MPRLTNAVTGVTIDVPDEKAAGIQGAWKPAAAGDAPAEKKSAPKAAPRAKSE